MADFSTNATMLSAPQGAGAQPLAPVQETITQDQPLAGVGEAVSGFIQSISLNKKQEAADRKQQVMQKLGSELQLINQGLEQGKGTTWAAQQRWATIGKYVGQYGDLAQDIMEVNRAFDGTSLSNIERRQKQEDAVFQQRISLATTQGHSFYEGMSEQAMNATLAASDAERRLEWQTDQRRKQSAEARAEANEARAAYTFRDQQESAQLLTELAATNLDATQVKVADLREKVASGSMSLDEAQLIFSKDIQRLRAGMLAVSSNNPQLAGPWISLLTDMEQTATKLFDPSAKDQAEVARLDNQMKILLGRTQLMAVTQDPKLLGLYATGKLLGENVVVEMSKTSESLQAIARLTQSATDAIAGMPLVVGTPTELGVYDGLKAGVKNLPNMDAASRPQAQNEALNAANNLLKQTADVTGEIPAKNLSKAADFYASKEFYDLVKTGQIDQTSARNAQQVFQMQYVPKVEQAIVDRLNTEVLSVGLTGGDVGMRKLSESVNFSFDGNTVNITYDGRNAEGGSYGPQRERQLIKEAMTGLNTLVRLHANLEGTNNYEKYWNDNKHLLLPQYFPDPRKLKEGDVVNGKRYTGGNTRNPRNWQPVK